MDSKSVIGGQSGHKGKGVWYIDNAGNTGNCNTIKENKYYEKTNCKENNGALLAAVSLATTGTTAFAGTIPFNVTVGGSGTQDPLSKREIKTADGDNYAYFTGHTFSKPNVGIYVKSCQRENSNIYTSEAYLSSSNAGVTQKRLYNKTAEGGLYYYMKARAATDRITVSGNYCP
ncbi:hypothetical protein E5329_21920 [Petralouisia muris]|uniref:Uncharacterized protein n=1 Tax=Petralouisia muris TaxID=3032872 RepID=A0AC61RQU1_9FIRM|nr:hypothetical protein [Petralouisia muris]TGY91276.1 hypothetical protein E5329_21920 [Petralouisia muris]